MREAIDEIAARSPDRPAVRETGEYLSYGELVKRADRAAEELHAEGVRPGDLAGVCFASSTAFVVTALAVLRAGAGYLPFDPSHPAKRVSAMVSDSDPALLLTDEEHAPDARAHSARTMLLPTGAPEGAPTVPPSPQDVAYVVYTSGPTLFPALSW